ncbi:MAG: HigA family addiction module antitoxin, partial [Dolichospermum sp.]
IQEIINGEKSITVDIAIRLGKALGNRPRLWLNLQQKVDVWDALQSHQEEYNKVMTLVYKKYGFYYSLSTSINSNH